MQASRLQKAQVVFYLGFLEARSTPPLFKWVFNPAEFQ
jgi:hypothetical protein